MQKNAFAATSGFSQNVAFGVFVLFVMLGGAPCFGEDDSTPARAKSKGAGHDRLSGRDHQTREPGCDEEDHGLGRLRTDGGTAAVALPHDLQVVVTDDLPKGIDDPTAELDGRRIFWPATFFKQTRDVLTEFLPEVIHDKGAPKLISQENFTADVVNVWGNQFIFGHELGHVKVPRVAALF
jgi:hypothetical protein